jgi:serine/threonine protein kinase/Tol biopolymer transport system component
MALPPGARLGPYEIVSPVGAGGMGEVFKARDTRLDRTVAIKVLPAAIALDPQVRERFEREARIIAQLSHPHICTLHDVGRQDGIEFLVLEYVEGETLAVRLTEGPLPMDLVLRSAIEIADGLDRAHRAGIVHRDLKPSNIMLTRSGVKLLDFGLAKSLPVELSSGFASAETRTPTKSGTLVGTLQYMAPEQLDGQDVDSRTDLFALGAVIYEMTTGRRAFDGTSQASVIGAILHTSPPPLSTLQPLASPALDRVVARCLQKDPEFRWQHARDIMLELQAIWEHPEPAATSAVTRARPWLPWLAAALASALAMTILIGAVAWRRSSPAGPIVRATIASPANARFTFMGDFGGPPVIAPDGRTVAFVASLRNGVRQVWIRPLDALEATPLSETDDATFPFWSADSRAIGFFAAGKLKRVDLPGGSVLTLCAAASGRGGAWTPNGIILFTPTVRDGIYQVPANGGEPRAVTRLDPRRDTSHRWPAAFDDGKTFLFLAIPQDPARRDESSIYVATLDGRDPQLLVRSSAQAAVAGDEVLYLRDTTLLSQRFSPESQRLIGDPFVLAQNVQHDPTIWRGVFAASAQGPLVYQAGGDGGRTSLTWFDRTGRSSGMVGDPGIYFDLNIAPDGHAVAVNRGDPADIWVYEFSRGTATRVTSDDANQSLPIWSPDSQRIIFSSAAPDGRGTLFEAMADRSDSPRLIFTGDVAEATDWSRDGRFVLIKVGDLRTKPGDIWVLPLADPAQAVPIVATTFGEYHGRFSPDTRWIAYVSNESGRDEVYVTAFQPPDAHVPGERTARDPKRPGRWQVSTAGGVLPRWNRNGSELYYLAPDRRLMAARVDGRGNAFRVMDVQPLFQADPKPVGWLYDVAPDGRFLVNTLGAGVDAPMILVLNWTRRGR